MATPTTGDRVLFAGHPSWRAVWSFYLRGVGFAILGCALTAAVTDVVNGSISVSLTVLVGIIAVLVVLVVGFVKRISTTYEITEGHLRIRRGLLTRDLQECRLNRVQNVTVRQELLERILRFGDVDFDTAGTAGADFSFRGVGNPQEIMRRVNAAQRAAEAAGSGIGAQFQPQPQFPPQGPPPQQPYPQQQPYRRQAPYQSQQPPIEPPTQEHQRPGEPRR